MGRDCDRGRRPRAQPGNWFSRDEPYERDRRQRHNGQSEKGMREVSMIVEIVERAAGRRDNVDIRGIRREQQDRRGEGRPSLQARTAEKQADGRVGELVHE